MSRRKLYIVGFLCLIVFDTLTQLSFKMAAIAAEPTSLDLPWLLRAFSAPWLYACIAGYLCALVTWVKLLQHAPVGPAFAATHMEVVVVTVVSVPLFGEQLSGWQMFGAALIIAGVLVLAAGEHGKHSAPVGEA